LDRRGDRRGPRARRHDDRRPARTRPRPALAPGPGRRPAPAVPPDARGRLRAPGRRAARLHLHGGLAGDGRPHGPRAPVRRRGRVALGDRRRPLHGPGGRALRLSRGQGEADPRARRRGGHRPRRLLRVLRQRVGPTDAARGRASCGGQPRRAPGERGPGGGMGGPALRHARQAPEGGGRAARLHRGRRRRRRGPAAPGGGPLMVGRVIALLASVVAAVALVAASNAGPAIPARPAARPRPAAVVDVPPAPNARVPGNPDRMAPQRFSVGWPVLAAVNHVESAFGRLRSPSVTGAQGPMQFLPSTWSTYGMGGDVHNPRDAILAAANFLHAHGAPASYAAALYAY